MRWALHAGALLLATPGSLLAAGEGGAPGASLFGINLGLAFWTVLVFLILLFLLRMLAWGPMLGMLDERQERIQGALDESAEKREEAERLLREHKEQLADARRQAQEIVAEGKAAGQKVREEIEEKARAEAEKILERARNEIEREKDAALAELRRESVDLAMAAATRLMGERMDRDHDRELVLGYLDDLSSDGGSAGSGAREGGAGA